MERIDHIGFGNLRLIQDTNAFCYGVDAVILAHFAAGFCKPAVKALDIGTGTGVIPLMLSHMCGASEIVGVEIQERSFELANRNVSLNGLDGKLRMVRGDIADAGLLQDENGSFGLIVSNPPYVKKSSGMTSGADAKMIARHETTAGLDAFVETAARLLKPMGSFCMVHRPDRLVDIFDSCRKHRLEPKHMRLVSPDRSKAPNIVLIHCVKHGGPNLTLFKPLYVYDESGEYTTEINEIYER
ncbi:MAG: tRNA1(Val) (adenine(37)-N6)-methyltransferase [Clostridiales bacterium]|nr:tRNA1(Val) (adenine(37)-N6)-methyltransferase [Clostridiales bacterium]